MSFICRQVAPLLHSFIQCHFCDMEWTVIIYPAMNLTVATAASSLSGTQGPGPPFIQLTAGSFSGPLDILMSPVVTSMLITPQTYSQLILHSDHGSVYLLNIPS